MERGDRNWPHYYWSLSKHIGLETYRTWRWELFSSVPLGFFVAFLNGDWADFKTALAATGMTLGCFVIWHALRGPWLLHKSNREREPSPGILAGILGIVALSAVLLGSARLVHSLWDVRPLGIIQATIKPPPAPVVQKRVINVTEPGPCKLTLDQVNPIRATQPCAGSPPPTLEDRVLALNAHLTEGDRNRFSNALEEFAGLLKQMQSLAGRISVEGGRITNRINDRSIIHNANAEEEELNNLNSAAWKLERAFPVLREKWNEFEPQEQYIFGDNPDNLGPNSLLNALSAESNSLTNWDRVQDKQDALVLLTMAQGDFGRSMNTYGTWSEASLTRLREMRNSIR